MRRKRIQLEQVSLIWLLAIVMLSLIWTDKATAQTLAPTITDVCAQQLTQRACAKYVATSCLWYSPPGLCRTAPYCDSAWNATMCTSFSNNGSCEFVSNQCQYRTPPLPLVNAGVDCFMPCNPPGPTYKENYLYNAQCNFCGTQGFCCNTLNPNGCIPKSCSSQYCCAEAGAFSPTISGTMLPSASPSSTPSKSPSRQTTSPTTSRPSGTPTSSMPTKSPSTSLPTQAPTGRPSASPSKKPTSSSPSLAPSSSAPSVSPSLAPTSSKPSFSPTVTQPTTSPTSSSPTAVPTTSTPMPTRSPDKFAALESDDQQAWNIFRSAFKDQSFCYNGPSGNACEACGTDILRHIGCEWVTPTSSGQQDRLLQQQQLRITEIRMRNANLSGFFPLNVLINSLPYLRVLDLSNDPGMDLRIANDIQYIGQGGCLPFAACVNGQLTCVLPESLPPLCSRSQLEGQTSSGVIPLYGYIAIAVGGLLIMLLCMLVVCFFVRRQRRGERKSRQLAARKGSSALSPAKSSESATPAPPRRSTAGTSMGERRVSFTAKPALVFLEDPNEVVKGKDKKRRRSSASKRNLKKQEKRRRSLLKQWRQEYDTATGLPYWVNKKSGEFSWVGPGEEKPQDEGLPIGQPENEDSGLQHFSVSPSETPAPTEGTISSSSKRNKSPSGSNSASTSTLLAAAAKDPDVWDMVYDETSKSRYLLNTITGEFVALPSEDREGENNEEEKQQEVFVTRGASSEKSADDNAVDSDEEAMEHDPLWKVERDPESGEYYWIDVETGNVSWTMPSIGTIVSSEMLAATGRYNLGQVYMRKPPYMKRPSVVFQPHPPDTPPTASEQMTMRRSSSGLNSFLLPRRSSGLESLDLGRRSSALGQTASKENVLGSPRASDRSLRGAPSEKSLRGSRLSMKSSQTSMSSSNRGRHRRRRDSSSQDDSDDDDDDDDEEEEEVTVNDPDLYLSNSYLVPHAGGNGGGRTGGGGRGYGRGRWARDDSLSSEDDGDDSDES